MWQRLGPIATGGTVFGIAVNPAGQAWLATGAGILQKTEACWRPIPQSRPLAAINALCAAEDGKWFAAGLTGGLIRSWDAGRSWQFCWLDQVNEPITCLAVSPRYAADATLLAGTNGAGILRSSDGGKRWFLSNFGLQDFTILALAMASNWSRREYVFAGTLAGVYRSSGGGRAWKLTGLADMAIQALATSAQFAENGLVIAGTEAAGLYRSSDGGRSWQPVGGDFAAEFSVNVLLNFVQPGSGQEYWLAGADDGGLWRSVDAGQHWTPVYQGDNPVLALAGTAGSVLAGLSTQGLLTSADAGQTWQTAAELPAYGFQRLRLDQAGRFYGIAPNEGVWVSADQGQGWSQAIEASLSQPLFDFAVLNSGQTWLAAWADGLWRRTGQTNWQPVLAADEGQIVALAGGGSPGRPVWAATPGGYLWRSADEGRSWQVVRSPLVGQQLLALAVSAADSTLVAASLAPQGNELSLWRWDEPGSRWEEWFSRRVPPSPYVRLQAAGGQAEQTRLVINNELWSHAAGEWQKTASFERTIRQVAADSRVYLLVGYELFAGDEAGDWTPVPLPEGLHELIDIQAAPGDHLYGLDVTGVVWRYEQA